MGQHENREVIKRGIEQLDPIRREQANICYRQMHRLIQDYHTPALLAHSLMSAELAMSFIRQGLTGAFSPSEDAYSRLQKDRETYLRGIDELESPEKEQADACYHRIMTLMRDYPKPAGLAFSLITAEMSDDDVQIFPDEDLC